MGAFQSTWHQGYNLGWNTSTSATTGNTYIYTPTPVDTPQQTYIMQPVEPIVVKKEPETALGWLREQVAEICELAYAA